MGEGQEIQIFNRLLLNVNPCIIQTSKMPYDVTLGMNFLRRFGFSMRIGKYSINKYSPTFLTVGEIKYWRKVPVKN